MNSGANRLHSHFSPRPLSAGLVDPPRGSAATARNDSTDSLTRAIRRTTGCLLSRQAPEGYWVAELEGDTILESEYALLLTYLGRGDSETVKRLAQHILAQQLPEGGWSLYPGGPIEISGSVKAYWTLKIAGHDPESEPMQRARRAILAAGGVEKVNSFTRYYLALLGAIEYRQCPAVPPELMLIPAWAPMNIYEMSAWSRTILVPLSLLWAFQPVSRLPEELQIRELFCNFPEELPVTMGPSESLDDLSRKRRLPWEKIFRLVDRCWKGLEGLRIKPFRGLAKRRAHAWMVERFAESDGLGAIFPPIIWSVVALKCLGYEEDSAEVAAALGELEALMLDDEDGGLRLQPCKSPVWDTALTVCALREAGVRPDDEQLQRTVNWLLSKEVRRRGDWSMRNRGLKPGGWFFEYHNAFYPDLDDTAMVAMALGECLSSDRHAEWMAALIATGPQGHTNNADLAAVVSGHTSDPAEFDRDLQRIEPILGALGRGVKWALGMQCSNGGWGAFDRDNDRELLTRVPFADHNAMIDPPTADITARVLEMFGRLGADPDHPSLQKAIDFVWSHQEPDGAWYGRWGVNYIYGTWQVLVGLQQMGVSPSDPRIQAGAKWLRDKQQPSGAWGETPASYDNPELRGTGEATASQTAWALMGLMAAGEIDSEAVRRGVAWLIETQQPDGTWVEEPFTGTGFPRVFYLKYHLYAVYFPLMALGRYARLTGA